MFAAGSLVCHPLLVPPDRRIRAAIRQEAAGRAIPQEWMKQAVARLKSGCDMGDIMEEFCATYPLDVNWAAYMPKGGSANQPPSITKYEFFAAARAHGHPMKAIAQQYALQPEVLARKRQRKDRWERNQERRVVRRKEFLEKRSAAIARLEEAEARKNPRGSSAHQAPVPV